MGLLLFDVMQAVESADMPPNHRHLMIRMANYAGEDGRAWPSLTTLERATGLARSTVAECISELVAAGWLSPTASPSVSKAYLVRSAGGPISAHARHRPNGKKSPATPEAAAGYRGADWGVPRRGPGGYRGADPICPSGSTHGTTQEPPNVRALAGARGGRVA